MGDRTVGLFAVPDLGIQEVETFKEVKGQEMPAKTGRGTFEYPRQTRIELPGGFRLRFKKPSFPKKYLAFICRIRIQPLFSTHQVKHVPASLSGSADCSNA